jgi:hypothetical protein
MKTLTQTFAIILLTISSATVFAGGGNLSLDEDNPLKAVTLDVERSGSQVLLNLTAKDANKYKSMIVERSASEIDAFSQVCVITGEEIAETGATSVSKVDNYPITAQSTSYYRVKVVEESGVIRFFPAVELHSLSASK